MQIVRIIDKILLMTNDEFINNLTLLKARRMSALQNIYQEYFEKIFQTALVIVRNRDDAYDIAMDVIIRLCNYPGNEYEIKNHVGLLVTMTRNMSFNFLKRKSRQTELSYNDDVAISDVNDVLWLEDIFSILSEEEREIFIRHVIWDMKLKSIAKELEKPYGSVRKKYAGIKCKIKDIYKQ